jgi:hypothetical protein
MRIVVEAERDMSGNLSVKEGGPTNKAGVLHSLVAVYSSWTTILTNALFFVGYFLLFYAVIYYSNFGFFLLTVPSYLLGLLVLASSCSATVAVAYLRISRRRNSIPGVAQSPIGVALVAFVASCSCNIPLLAPILYFIGLNAIEVSGVISFLASYQAAIFEVIIVVNLLSIYYYLSLISRSGLASTNSGQARSPGQLAPLARGNDKSSSTPWPTSRSADIDISLLITL